jgi:signal transduction histidine kinase
MGRWTVKHIVTKHGRSIQVESKLDQGRDLRCGGHGRMCRPRSLCWQTLAP